MKRKFAGVLLIWAALGGVGAVTQNPGQQAGEPTDIAVRSVRGIGPVSSSRLCIGARNAVRVELALHGASPSGAVPLRLVMVLPGGDPAGVLVAEGSVTFVSGATTASFTFLNVDVPARMQGRGARLEVRVNYGADEQNLSNNGGAIALDQTTDWSCRS